MKCTMGMLGFLVVAYATSLATTPCRSEITRAPSPPAANVSARTGPLIADQGDYDDDFVPYQGERITVFDWTLFKATSKRYPGNVLISPISLKLALVLLYEGAQDETAHELAAVMQLPVTRTAVRDRFSTILRSLQAASPTYTLNCGTRLYIDSGIMLRQQYSSIVKAFYDTDVISANLSDAKPIVQAINGWVSNLTDSHIDRMIEDGSDIENSLMVIMNAIYFRGSWRRKYFSPEDTKMDKFHTIGKGTVDVPYMHAYGRFYYSESPELDAKILRIPYSGRKFAMYLLLPRTADGIERLTNEVNPFVLTRYIWVMQDLPVNVTIPKFKFDFAAHMETMLRELGIRDIFDDTATLTGIARTKRTSKRLKVSDILQKAGIEVNENGTTAYVATEIDLGNKIADQTFHADHPFVFYIEDESTGAIIYMGKVTNPLDTVGSAESTSPQNVPGKFGPPVPDADSILQAGLNAEDRNNLFNAYFSQALSKEYSGRNLVSSPADVKLALSMLLEGAEGETRTEIVSTLRLPEDESRRRAIAQRVLTSLKRNESGTEIGVTCRLWIHQNLRVLSTYEHTLRSHYQGDIQPVNFEEPQTAAQLINDWIRRATNDAIATIPSLTDLPPDTRLLLTSAIYFKGRWLKAFDKANTKQDCFYTAGGECRNTYFMKHESIYRYAYISSIEAHVLEIPYSDGKTSMLTLMPYARENDPHLRILAEDLANVPVSAILANLKRRDVTVHLPKFTIENSLKLQPTLQRLGIGNIFQPDANFTRMISSGSVRVSSILQNVKIEVDETGTLAAADTEIGFEFLASFGNDIKYNRPFLFMIVDTVTSTILFYGRFVEPR